MQRGVIYSRAIQLIEHRTCLEGIRNGKYPDETSGWKPTASVPPAWCSLVDDSIMTPAWGVHVNQIINHSNIQPFSAFSVHPFTYTSPYSTSVEPVQNINVASTNDNEYKNGRRSNATPSAHRHASLRRHNRTNPVRIIPPCFALQRIQPR